MKKTLVTDIKLLRYLPLIIINLSALTIMLKIFIGNDSLTKLDQNYLTFNFSDTLYIFLVACVFFILTQKYDNLRKYKLTAWYDTLPVSIKDIHFSNFILVIVPHILLFIFACLYYAINDDFFKFHGIMLMFGISLIMNGCMLIFGIKNPFSYVILAGIGGAFLIFAFGFHYLLVMNDFNMHLNLSENIYWHFYLYQMPYILTVIGFIVCIISLFIYKNR
ncbi:hypothetical protein ETI06_07885 [Macrococcoides goetzii]|nr:hypothetical protein [Macrococcus goetzii]TDM42260.1 hypothetical protein ETI10_03960 [Macrococcus goetzii]TDM47805.1 hypothetical protein ETI08_01340 [Macrococcus goetzii]TDM48939.1 hypothetical protein ETI06_07885 [Macrococcus goetzii]